MELLQQKIDHVYVILSDCQKRSSSDADPTMLKRWWSFLWDAFELIGDF